MKSVVYIAIFLISSHSYGQEWLEDTLELKGNVKAVHYTRTAFISEDEEDWWTMDNKYRYNTLGYLVKSTISGNVDGDFAYSTARIYNELGDKCIEEYDLEEGDTMAKRLFIYDSLDRIKKSNYYTGGKLWSITYFKYNEQDLVTEKLAITARKDSLWERYEYDALQRMITYVDSSKSLHVVKTWAFDSKNRLIEFKSEKLRAPKPIVVEMGSNGEVRDQKTVNRLPKDNDHSIITYHYNKANQRIKKTQQFIDSDEGSEVVYTYNDEGDISTEIYLDTKTDIENKSTILYDYDKMGNWITKSFYWNGEMDEKETREIEYY